MTETIDLSVTDERPVSAWRLLLLVAPLALLAAFAMSLIPANRLNSSIAIGPPPSPPPQVEPLEVKQIAPETAKEINAGVPFIEEKYPAAKPFRLAGSATDTARATDCLASAIYYEAASEKTEGQKAVAQVILNRVRHPAFPSTVCGVVYQGATRRTGCQFSFSCDGSMARRPSAELWSRLRGIATTMLHGEVYAPVGLATHYHTDWVVPYWSAKLDKLRAEQTHLFFRWNGWWGTPTAFRQRYTGGEPLVSRMAGLSAAHAALPGEVAIDSGSSLSLPGGTEVLPVSAARLDTVFASPAGNFLLMVAAKSVDPAGLPEAAKVACGSNSYCKVMVWTDRATMPANLPVNEAQRTAMAFSYLRDTTSGLDRTLWNCNQFRRTDPLQCMRDTVPASGDRPAPVGPVSSAKSAVTIKPVIPPGFKLSTRAGDEDDVLIPVNPDNGKAADPSDRLRPGTDSFGGRRRPGGGGEP